MAGLPNHLAKKEGESESPLLPDIPSFVRSRTSYTPMPLAGDGPKISFGEDAPHPRWVFVETAAILPPSQSAAPPTAGGAIRPRAARAMQPPERPAAAAPGRMGILAWMFDAGPEAGWGGLSFNRLYVHAYTELEDALDDPFARERLREVIRNSKTFASKVSGVEDPLPPLPPAPDTDYVSGQIPGSFYPGYVYDSYARPSLARQRGDVADGPPFRILAKMRNHKWGGGHPSDLSPESGDTVDLFWQESPSDGTSGSPQARQSNKAPGNPPQWLDGAAPVPVGSGLELVNPSTEAYELALWNIERAQAAGEINGRMGEPITPASTVKAPGRESPLKAATGLKRKREVDVNFDREIILAKSTQRTATPVCKAGPNGHPGQRQTKAQRLLAVAVPAKREMGESRKGAQYADMSFRRNPPRKAKRMQ